MRITPPHPEQLIIFSPAEAFLHFSLPLHDHCATKSKRLSVAHHPRAITHCKITSLFLNPQSYLINIYQHLCCEVSLQCKHTFN